jgi:hypothetical protein
MTCQTKKTGCLRKGGAFVQPGGMIKVWAKAEYTDM